MQVGNQEQSIAFVGGGRITQAMVRGLLAAGYSAKKILVCTPSPERQHYFIEQQKIIATGDNGLAARFADTVILAVKPELIAQVCTELAESMLQTNQQKLVISLASGVAHTRLRELLSGSNRIVCAIPNIAVKLRKGMTGLYCDPDCDFRDRQLSENIMASIGETLWVNSEAQLADIDATASTSPAYLFYILAQMQQAAVEQGLSEQDAQNSVLQAAWGAISLAMETDLSFTELCDSITATKSSAEDAVELLQQGNLSTSIKEAMLTVKRETRKAQLQAFK